MKQQPKKNKRLWLKIPLITLAIMILMIPLVLYIYLAYDHFHIDDKRAAYTFDAPYAGEAVYQANGDVKIPLTAEDLYWLIDEYQLLNLSGIPGVDCHQVAVDIGDATITVYADVLYKGVLPLPAQN